MPLAHSYSGGARYLFNADVAPHRLLIAVPCAVGDPGAPLYGLLDTGAEWSVLPAETVQRLDLEPGDGEPPVRLTTRFGTFVGGLVRVPVEFLAAEGESLTIEATVLACPDWPGPLVLGWRGCLERFRFALDPSEDMFYFAQL